MDIDIICADLINGAKTHFGKQGNPGFYRVQLKGPDLAVVIKKKWNNATLFSGLPIKKSSTVYAPQECDWFLL